MSNIVLKKFLFNAADNSLSDKIKRDKYNWFSNAGFYELIGVLGSNRMVKIALLLTFIFGYYINRGVHLGHFYGLFICIIVFWALYTHWKEDASGFFSEKQNKLEFLNNILSETTISKNSSNLAYSSNWLENQSDKSFLYTNPAVIDFYYNYREYVDFAFSSYANSLKACNDMLNLREQMKISVNNPGNQLTTAELLQKDCLNYFQSSIYKMPSADATNDKFKNGLILLQKITEGILHDMQISVTLLNKKNGINIEYYPIHSGTPKPNDMESHGFSAHYDVYT